jgi:hypothetical protein
VQFETYIVSKESDSNNITVTTEAYTFIFATMSELLPEPFFDDVVIGDYLPPNETNDAEEDVHAIEKSAKKSGDGKEVETGKRGSQWTSGELIAAFLSFEAARRQKSTSSKTYRVEFAGTCFPKFAAQLQKEGLFYYAIDNEKSRAVRFKYSKFGKNSGESSTYTKVVDVKKDVVNIIIPLFEKLAPGGVPPNGF